MLKRLRWALFVGLVCAVLGAVIAVFIWLAACFAFWEFFEIDWFATRTTAVGGFVFGFGFAMLGDG